MFLLLRWWEKQIFIKMSMPSSSYFLSPRDSEILVEGLEDSKHLYFEKNSQGWFWYTQCISKCLTTSSLKQTNKPETEIVAAAVLTTNLKSLDTDLRSWGEVHFQARDSQLQVVLIYTTRTHMQCVCTLPPLHTHIHTHSSFENTPPNPLILSG